MKMKRVLAGLLAIAMLSSIVGCAKEKNTEQSQATSVESGQTEETREVAREENSQKETSQKETSQKETSQKETSQEEKIDEWEIAYEQMRERQEKFLEKKVEYGDEVYLSCYRQAIAGEEGMEYLGGALLLVGEGVRQFAAGDAECPEAVVTELLQKVQGRNPYSEAIKISDDRYEYWFAIRTVNWYKKPSFQLPKDWDYKFDAPQIGSFQAYSLEHAGTDDNEDGEFFGFPDWLTDGCSDWCGCSEYICEIEATSQLADQGGVNYSPSNLRAESRNSVWSEGVEGSGIGESIFIKQMYAGIGDVEFTISDICIVNGYAQNETKWQENGRVKSLKLYYEDEYIGEIALEDTMNPQFIDVRPVQMKVGNGFDANFRFEIAEVYEGTKYEDTCLAGILIDFEGKSAH